MNIWIINHYASEPSSVGVGGHRHYDLARHLIANGHKVTIVASAFNHFTHENKLSKNKSHMIEEIDEITFIWLKTVNYKGNSLRRVLNMLDFSLRLLVGKVFKQVDMAPDIILGSSPHPLAAFSAKKLAKRYGIPFVLEIRDIWPQTLVELGNISKYHPFVLLLEGIERYLYNGADHIVSLLPGAYKHIVEKGGDKRNITWIPNGIEINEKHVPLHLLEHSTSSEKEGIVVTYAGSHGIANALDSIVDTAKNLQYDSRLAFHFIGDGAEKLRLQKRAKEEGIKNLFFFPPVPKHRVSNILESSDILIATLRNSNLYGYGISLNKLYDYLLAARPVVFGGDNAFNNPIQEARAGFTVAPENVKEMSEAILRICDMSVLERQEMGRKGHDFVKNNYSFDILTKKLEDVFIKVLSENGYHSRT